MNDRIINQTAREVIINAFEDETQARLFILETQVATLTEILNVVLPYALDDDESRELISRYAKSRMLKSNMYSTDNKTEDELKKPVRYGIWARTMQNVTGQEQI